MSYETDTKLIQMLEEVPLHKWAWMGPGGWATVMGDYRFQISKAGQIMGIYVYLRDFPELFQFYVTETAYPDPHLDPLYEPLKDLWDKLMGNKDKCRANYKEVFEGWVSSRS